MTKKEIHLLVCEEAYKQAKEQYQKAFDDDTIKGSFSSGKILQSATIALKKAESNYKEAKDAMIALNDNEVDELVNGILGKTPKPETLDEQTEKLCDNIANNIY